MAKLKIGIVGAGNIANAHLAAYRNVDDAEIAAICDINKVRLNETADLFGMSCVKNRWRILQKRLRR